MEETYANLLCLDAINQGKDRNPGFLQILHAFQVDIIGELYRYRYLMGDIDVTDVAVDTFYTQRIVQGPELADLFRVGIEATMYEEVQATHSYFARGCARASG